MIKNGLPAIRPGEFLREAHDDMQISQAEFARVIGVAPMRISHVMNGARPVTAELVLLFGRALRQSLQYSQSLQAAYDLRMAEHAVGARLRRAVERAAA